MRLFIIFLFLPAIAFGQPMVKLTIDPGSFICRPEYREGTIQAFAIASQILSSTYFDSVMSRATYVYPNHCRTCNKSDQSGTQRIPWKTIVDSMNRHSQVTINIDLEENEPKGALGSTCPWWVNGKNLSKANYGAIEKDMPELPLKYRLAANLCHEYIHYVGFCHPDDIDAQPDDDTPAPIAYRDDVAYKAGWEAYYMAKKMYEASKE